MDTLQRLCAGIVRLAAGRPTSLPWRYAMRWCCVSQAATLEQLLICESCHLAISYSGSARHGMNLCAACVGMKA